MKRISKLLFFGIMLWALQASLQAQETRQTVQFDQIKSYLDSVPAIDTHDHLWPFDQLPGSVQTQSGKGMNLFALTAIGPLSAIFDLHHTDLYVNNKANEVSRGLGKEINETGSYATKHIQT